jgi:ATP-dependent helicase/DNAse subunit B
VTIDLIIAPPASGKTAECIDRILAAQKGQLLAQVWVLVPNPQAAAQFKARLAEAGGGMGVRVGEFRHFYKELIEENGMFMPIISRALSHRLIQETVREAFDAGELVHYSAIKDKPGFITVLRDAFSELRSAMVLPSTFLGYTRDATLARRELAILYNRYSERLISLGWTDGQGQAWLAIEALQTNPSLASRLSLVIVDGFSSFDTARRQFLKLLGEQTGEMIITLTGESGSDRQVDSRSAAEFTELKKVLPLEIHELNVQPRLPAESLHMQQHVLDTGEVVKLNPQKPFLLKARSQSDEARETLRWIKELHVRQHVPLDACAIYAANLEMYQPLLRSAAEEFGIRVHFTQADPLSESPAVLAVLDLLQLPLEDFPTRLLLNTLRSPYFNCGLEAKDLENLENVSQQAIIVSGKGQWEDAWPMLERSDAAEEHLDEERRRKNRTKGIDLPALRVRLERFWHLYDQIETDRSQTEWVEWLESMLTNLGFYDQINSERDREACDSLGDALRALLLSESVVGTKVVDYAQFLTDLQGSLLGAKVEEPREARRNAVFIGTFANALGARYEAVALVGLSEGLFPVVENPDPFLDEQLRIVLGLEPKLGRHQASTFYQAFTRANTHLLLTRPYLTEEGEKWEPSPYWQATAKVFTEKAITKVQASMPRSQSEAASPQELLFWAVQQQKLHYSNDPELIDRWQGLHNAHRVLDQRRSKLAQGVFDGGLVRLTDQLTSKFSAEYVWSASRLETYKACPFRFFVDAVLKLEPKETPELGLDVAQRGSIIHRVLENVYRRAGEEGVPPLELLDEVAEGVFAKAPWNDEFRPSALWEVEKAELLEKLCETVEALELEQGKWNPFGFEHKFGIGSAAPLALEIDGNLVQIRGVIDRLDVNPEGGLRVIDYKSGSPHLSKIDLLNGSRLQLPIYALAAQEALGLGEVEEGFYWSINEAKAGSIKLSSFTYEGMEGPEAAYQAARVHIQEILEGTRVGNFAPKAPKGGCPDYCSAKSWCWRYEAGYKND